MGLRVLVADDDLVGIELITRVLRKLGHTVFAAANGAQAWKHLEREEKFDHVISDYDMPEMDGLSLLSKIREDERFKKIAFTLMSGDNVVSQANPVPLELVCRENGAGFIPKPIEDILQTFKELLGQDST